MTIARTLHAAMLTLVAATTLAAAPALAQNGPERAVRAYLLRRLGFGPSRFTMAAIAAAGGRVPYIIQQLNAPLDDGNAARFTPQPACCRNCYPTYDPKDPEACLDPPRCEIDDPNACAHATVQFDRWHSRMTFGANQLRERMVLVLHELFAVSTGKIYPQNMRDYEELLRAHALGSFPALLAAITRDNAMLFFLDNAGNSAIAGGSPPNENYARELMQLYALGANQLDDDGTPLTCAAPPCPWDALDVFPCPDLTECPPVPAYDEDHVRALARALTGFDAYYPLQPEDPSWEVYPATFDWNKHNWERKDLLGGVIEARDPTPEDPGEVEEAVAILMAQRTMAPFIAKQLIQKLATENPSKGYVRRVTGHFRDSYGDLKTTLYAIFTDPEFYSEPGSSRLRREYKEPIELLVGAMRGLDTGGATPNVDFYSLLYYVTEPNVGQHLWAPPSVFSFYRPGRKRTLVNARYVLERDMAADFIVENFDWNVQQLIRQHHLTFAPRRAVDLMSLLLLGERVRPDVKRAIVYGYRPDERITPDKLRGIAWLILASPDYQQN